MVSRIVAVWLCLLASACSLGKGTAFAEKTEKNSKSISGITISNNGAWSDNVSSDETAEECKTFLLTETDVRQFFELARVATDRDFDHELIMSRCF